MYSVICMINAKQFYIFFVSVSGCLGYVCVFNKVFERNQSIGVPTYTCMIKNVPRTFSLNIRKDSGSMFSFCICTRMLFALQISRTSVILQKMTHFPVLLPVISKFSLILSKKFLPLCCIVHKK